MPLDDKNRTTIADYVGDMVAVETHIEEALDRQLQEVASDPIASAAVQQFHTLVKTQRDALKALQDQVGTTAGNPVIAVGSALLGKAAGVIDKLRTEGISKSLRDDYVAFNLAAVSYTMLFTTATALGDARVAAIAERHLRGYAEAIQQINHLIGVVVVAELGKDGHTVVGDAAQATRTLVDGAWQETAPRGSSS